MKLKYFSDNSKENIDHICKYIMKHKTLGGKWFNFKYLNLIKDVDILDLDQFFKKSSFNKFELGDNLINVNLYLYNFKEIYIPKYVILDVLDCRTNRLTLLDIKGCCKHIDCSDNYLETLDITLNKTEILNCSQNPLSEINLPNTLKSLKCIKTNITFIELPQLNDFQISSKCNYDIHNIPKHFILNSSKSEIYY